MEQRYRAAEKFLIPNAATRVANLRPLGTWLDDTQFAFTLQRYDAATDTLVETAMIANAASASVAPAVPEPSSEASDAGPAIYAPDGRHAVFVEGYDLWLRDRRTGETRNLTKDGIEHHAYGSSPESDLAAISGRKAPRPKPFALWSPDSAWVLTHRIDERSVRQLGLVQTVPEAGFRPVTHSFRYPMPGDEEMASAELIAIHAETGRIVRVADPHLLVFGWSPFFLGQMWWSEDSSELYFIDYARFMRGVTLYALTLATGVVRKFAEEHTDTYVDLNLMIGGAPNVRVLQDPDEVVWFSERDGWGHLYLLDGRTGAVKKQITRGAWNVRDIIHLDARTRRIYFTANGVEAGIDPYYRQLCAVDLDGTNFRQLTSGEADHYVAVRRPAGLPQDDPQRLRSYAATGASPDGRYFVVTRSRIDLGAKTTIIDADGRDICTLAEADLTWLESSGWRKPLRFEALAADGVTKLYGAIFLPSFFDERETYPVIDHIYPGPQINQVPKDFCPSMMRAGPSQALAELGFAVVLVDGRGTPFRSRAFHLESYGKLHEAGCLDDHVAVLNQLCDRYKFLDRNRIGITGQSGGGFATARAMFAYPDFYKAGVSVCGNHEQRAYTALWFSKYHGPLGQETDEAQANASIAHQLKGKLLLIHGDMDENVHVGHTLRVVDALVRADKDFDLLIVPNAGHGVLVTHVHATRRQWDYFVRHLAGAEPPRDFKIEVAPERMAQLGKLMAASFQ